MKWLLLVAVIAGCLAHLDASKIIRRTNSGEVANTAFFEFANSGGIDGALEAAGDTVGGIGGTGGATGGNDANDDGGDTPDGVDGGGAAVAGGGGNEVGEGDSPDGADSPDFNAPSRGGGFRAGNGRPVLKNSGQSPVVDDQAEQAGDPGQIVGTTATAGTTAGIVVGVVALVGIAAGVAVYVIKKRN
ncbi:circumsporozoite protein-like [Acanthaster planci]|uniref:Circumsporozoite protein-like n=1 Tax=Acanthaster planci TaxID=133434 RepID=A0A8B7ZI50_ACAPL|nr:circumsporozoite protein-like [Acanthaster planci]